MKSSFSNLLKSLLLTIGLLSTSGYQLFSQVYSLDVGVQQFIPVPEVGDDYVVDYAIWGCDNEKVRFIEKNNSGAIVEVISYFEKDATIELYYVVRYVDYKGWTRKYSAYKYYTIHCNGSAPTLIPNGMEMKVGDTFQLQVSPTSYQNKTSWSLMAGFELAVTVSDDGLVTAKRTGTGIVCATVSGYANNPLTCLITVKDPKLKLNANKKSGTVLKGTEITLKASQSTATIYYTTDGSSPKFNGETYSSPIPVNNDMILKAVAYDENYEPSDIMTYEYTIGTAELSATPEGTVIPYHTAVSLKSRPASDVIIYYTTDGTSPTSNSDVYTAPIIVDNNLTLRAKAYHKGYEVSSEFVRQYEVTSLYSTTSYPKSGTISNSRHLIPSVTFSELIKEGDKYEDICLLAGDQPVAGETVISDSILFFVPDGDLCFNEYNLIVPEKALLGNDSPNLMAQITFNLKEPTYPLLSSAGPSVCTIIMNDGALWALGHMQNTAGEMQQTPMLLMDSVADVTSHSDHIMILKEDGTLWEMNTLLEMKQRLSDVTFISKEAGAYHYMAISDNKLYGWGVNLNGEVGKSSKTDYVSNPYRIKSLDGAVYASTGYDHTAAIKSDGSLWTWGSNTYGQLGNGTTTDSYKPSQVLENVAVVKATLSNTYALKKDGTLWAWGGNSRGEVGDGTRTDKLVPVQILEDVVSVAGRDGVVSAGGGGYAIKKDGSLWAWGSNAYGQVGDGSGEKCLSPVRIMDDVVSVVSGRSFAYAIKDDASLWAWGQNTRGQVGDGSNTNSLLPVKILENVASVSAGSLYGMAIKKDGSVWTWGKNTSGQLGDGTTIDRNVPTKVLDSVSALEEPSLLAIDGSITLCAGSRKVLTNLWEPSDADYESMKWSSFDESIASVSSKGVVTGISPGETTLTMHLISKSGREQSTNYHVLVTETDDTATLISSILPQLPISSQIHDLSGRRVNAPIQKGIYIINGKKIVK